MMDRKATINALFETMDVAKRTMHGRMQLVTNGCQISHTQLGLLFAINHRQPISFNELARLLYLTPGAVSQLAESLDKQGLIERQTDPADRRRQVLHVSEKGKELLRTIEKRRTEVMKNVMKDLSDTELKVWLHIQQKLINEFRTNHKETDEGS